MVASGAGNPFGGAGPGGFGGPGGGVRLARSGDMGDVGGLGDLLGNLFGGPGRRATTTRQPGAGPRRGGDLEAEVHLSFDDAVRGATIAVQLTGAAPCHTCGGSGAAPGTRPPDLPAVQRGRHAGRRPGPVLLLPDLPPLRRERPGGGEALPDAAVAAGPRPAPGR